MKVSWRRFLGMGLLSAFMVLAVLDTESWAQRRRQRSQTSTVELAEDKQPWKYGPYLAGVVLAAGTIMASLINARRSHLD